MTPRRAQNSSRSRLIEFPRRPQTSQSNTGANEPAWKAELTERVKAVKAKRSGGKAVADQYVEEVPVEAIREREPASSVREVEFTQTENPRFIEPGRTQVAAARMSAGRTTAASEKESASSPKTVARANDQIVEAALLRARRASENASRAALPVDSHSQTTRPRSKPPLVLDKEATAKAIEPCAEVKPKSALDLSAVTQIGPQTAVAAAPQKESAPAIPVTAEKIETRSTQTLLSLEADVAADVLPIDDIEPRDYLAAEIKKVDRELNAQFAHNESAPLVAHVILNVIDFIIISLSAAPFLALLVIYNGSFISRPTQVSSVGLILLVTLFYLALTQSLCGKTFGMMATNTRVVDAQTFETPSPLRAMLRSAGYFLAALPALFGFICLLFNRKRRGWHDYISGTMVARDF
ncbi:MAG TPA: RDD family protein [Blastocatellia bacterium]|nr:RDD family protein [Blastocatellia bacterium]